MSPVFEIEVERTGREVYAVEAVSEAEARQLYESGLLTDPVVSEVVNAEITAVQQLAETETQP